MKKITGWIVQQFIQFFNWFRKLFVKQITFKGDYADIYMARRKWQHEFSMSYGYDVILLSIDYKQGFNKNGKAKHNELTVFYVEDTVLMKWLGFEKNFVHWALSR